MSADQIAGKFYGDRSDDAPTGELEEYVVRINRCSKVVKGGRRLSFSAVVVVGDHQGTVGFGLGKANEVAEAIRKGGDIARKTLLRIKTFRNTIPHEVIGEFCGARVMLKPAADGTGVIAGGGVRAVLNLSGVHNIIAKSLGSNNKWNVVHATVEALKQLRTVEDCEIARGVELVTRRPAPAPEAAPTGAVAGASAPA